MDLNLADQAIVLLVSRSSEKILDLRRALEAQLPDLHVLSVSEVEDVGGVMAHSAANAVIVDATIGLEEGLEWCRRLRNKLACLPVPVLLMVSREHEDNLIIDKTLSTIDGILFYPPSALELACTVEMAVRSRQAQDSLRKLNGRIDEVAARRLQSLREECDFATAVLDTVGALIVVMDVKGRIVRFNHACQETTRYSYEEMKGHALWDMLLVPEEIEGVKAVFADLCSGMFPNYHENNWLTKSGQRRLISWSNTAVLGRNDEVRYVIGTGIDITERRQAEEANAELQKQLLHAQKLEAVGQLAGGLAHDFNNFLTAILGNAELIKTTLPDDSPARSFLATIEEAAQQASGVSRSLLMFSRKLPSQKKLVCLCDIVESALRILRHMLPSSIEVKLEMIDGRRLWINADSTQMQQVVLNLAINARDAMPRGGTLSVSVSPADASEAPDTIARHGPQVQFVRLCVQDTGTGIAPEIMPHIFEPFFTTKPRDQGSGLGLSISRGIVEQHGGWIECRSESGAGTTFTVYLPARKAPDTSQETSQAPSVSQGRGETILVAESNSFVRHVIARSLGASGYHVIETDDGSRLLEESLHHKTTIRLVLLDMALPGISVFDALKAIRTSHPSLPVLLTTAKVEADVETRLGEDVHFLRKPFQLAELSQLVQRILCESHAGKVAKAAVNSSEPPVP